MVLEEFGLGRDGSSYDPRSTVDIRDKYSRALFEIVYEMADVNQTMSGVNFWAWGGEGRPSNRGGGWWSKGDQFTGDPPHERQGWYSVYDTDISTKSVIRELAKKFYLLMFKE